MEVKKTTFKELDEIAKPDCIFASNTSSLSITEIGNGLNRPMVGMHSSTGRPYETDRGYRWCEYSG